MNINDNSVPNRIVENERELYKRQEVLFRVYPLPTATGVCRNEPYLRILHARIADFLKRRSVCGTYKTSSVREKYDYCPEGYRCRYYEIAVFFRTSTHEKKRWNNTVWIEVQ